MVLVIGHQYSMCLDKKIECLAKLSVDTYNVFHMDNSLLSVVLVENAPG